MDDNWSIFAAQNDAQEISGDHILNTNLYDHIEGPDTKHIFKVLFAKIREDKMERVVHFRCDTPAFRRFMKMRIYSDADKGLVFQTSTIMVEPFKKPLPLLTRLQNGGETILMCSACKKVKIHDDQWQEVEQALETLGLFNQAAPITVSHGFCDDCAEKYKSENSMIRS